MRAKHDNHSRRRHRVGARAEGRVGREYFDGRQQPTGARVAYARCGGRGAPARVSVDHDAKMRRLLKAAVMGVPTGSLLASRAPSAPKETPAMPHATTETSDRTLLAPV